MPSTRALFWSIARRITFDGSSQSNCTLRRVGIVAHDRARPRARSRAPSRCPRRTRGTAPGSRPAGRSRAATRGRAAPGKSVSKSASSRARTRSRSSLLVVIEHELREVRLLQLLVERQVEARAAGADVGDVALDARLLVEDRLQLAAPAAIVAANELPSGSRRSTISSARDDDGKNCCGTNRNSASAPTKTRERGADDDPAMRDAPVDDARGAGGRTACRRRRSPDRRAASRVRRGRAAQPRPQPRASDGAVALRRDRAASCSRGRESR